MPPTKESHSFIRSCQKTVIVLYPKMNPIFPWYKWSKQEGDRWRLENPFFCWRKYRMGQVDEITQRWKYSEMKLHRDGITQGWNYTGIKLHRDKNIARWKYSKTTIQTNTNTSTSTSSTCIRWIQSQLERSGIQGMRGWKWIIIFLNVTYTVLFLKAIQIYIQV